MNVVSGMEYVTPGMGMEYVTSGMGMEYVTPGMSMEYVTPIMGMEYVTPGMGMEYVTPGMGMEYVTPGMGTWYMHVWSGGQLTNVSIATCNVVVVPGLCECVYETTTSATVGGEATPTVLCVPRPFHLLYTELPSERCPIPVPENGVPNCDCDLVRVPYVPQSILNA